MPHTLTLILGAAYFIALIAIGIYVATLRLWLPYIIGSLAFLVVLFVCAGWAISGEDGPSGFAVLAAHGLVFWGGCHCAHHQVVAGAGLNGYAIHQARSPQHVTIFMPTSMWAMPRLY